MTSNFTAKHRGSEDGFFMLIYPKTIWPTNVALSSVLSNSFLFTEAFPLSHKYILTIFFKSWLLCILTWQYLTYLSSLQKKTKTNNPLKSYFKITDCLWLLHSHSFLNPKQKGFLLYHTTRLAVVIANDDINNVKSNAHSWFIV